jgi:hypothetical protein
MVRFGHGDAPASVHMYVTGDTLLVDELAEIRDRHPDIDLCMLHLGGTRIAGLLLTMDGEQGVKLLELLKPKTAIPVHFEDYTVFKSPLSDFLDRVHSAGIGTRIVTLDRGATYDFDVLEGPVQDAMFVKVFDTFIEHDGREWAVCSYTDGMRKVISRHATAELAYSAERELNESANRSVDESI